MVVRIKRIAVVCCIAVLLIVLGLIVFGNRIEAPLDQSPSPMPKAMVPLVIDPNIGYTPTPAPTEPGIAIPGWGSITLRANNLEAEADLYNPEDNKDWYYLTFQLSMKNTGEVVFQTGLIPPGMCCTKVTLNRAWEAGTYDGIMHVQPYYMRDLPAPTNNADFDIQIIIR